MKRCPTCNREFNDDTLSMCVDDGSPLISDIPGTPKPEFPATPGYTGLGGKATWSASPDDIPAISQYLATTAEPRKRWPLVIAIIGVLLVIVALIVVFVLIAR